MRSVKCVMVFVLAGVLFAAAGCESFSRKFTRKKSREQAVEMVLAPEDYPEPGRDPAALYKQNLLYWSAWYDEFLYSLSAGGNRKRRLYCLDESLKNLRVCAGIAGDAAGKEADDRINRLLKLRGEMKRDVYGNKAESFRRTAETLKMEISAYFGSIVPGDPGEEHVD